MPTQIDDISLILSFIQGQASFLSNRRLRVQPAHNVCQLMTVSGKLLAWAKHDETPARIGIRPLGEYSELLRQMLPEHEFMPIELNSTGQFLEYEYHPIPIGHEMNLSFGREFWKYWWANRKQFVGPQKETDLLVFTHRHWETVSQVSFHMSTLYITTLEGGTALHYDDQLVWIKPVAPEKEEDKTVFLVSQAATDCTIAQHLPAHTEPTPQKPDRLSSATAPKEDSGYDRQAAQRSPKESKGLQLADRPDRTGQRSHSPVHSPLDYVHQCSEQEWVIETPAGFLVITGQNLAMHTEHPPHPLPSPPQAVHP